jgi:hypothetical protein
MHVVCALGTRSRRKSLPANGFASYGQILKDCRSLAYCTQKGFKVFRESTAGSPSTASCAGLLLCARRLSGDGVVGWKDLSVKHQMNQACVDACNACADACDYCSVSCLQETEHP